MLIQPYMCLLYVYMSYVYTPDRHIYKYVPLIQICLEYISDRHTYIECVCTHRICQYVPHSIFCHVIQGERRVCAYVIPT